LFALQNLNRSQKSHYEKLGLKNNINEEDATQLLESEGKLEDKHLHSKIWDLEAKIDYYEMILKQGIGQLQSLGLNLSSIMSRYY
jgi:hypothetical protein